jgi:4-amino-4-deoxy-L-arabinose transferase-like glycosyltransferase
MKVSCQILLLLAFFMLAVRFWALDMSPPGFYADEAISAGSVSCFAETGESIWGDRYPLFFETKMYPVSPVFVYLGAAWRHVFGGSISAFRSFAALFGILACFGVAVAAYQFWGRLAAIMALSVAALSPWAFQFSRIAWDPAITPALAVLDA